MGFLAWWCHCSNYFDYCITLKRVLVDSCYDVYHRSNNINLIFGKKFMIKKILMVSGMFLALLLIAMPVLAEDVSSATVVSTTSVVDKIACVRTAVAVRESALAVAVADHSQAISAAYATRANELSGAYSNTTVKTVKAGVKVAWADFRKSIKSAATKWKTSRNSAWSTFRSAAKECKSPSGVSDSGNSGSELSGQ